MAKRSQNQSPDKAADAVGRRARKAHAAGSGSSTGDPGNARGRQPSASKSGQAPLPATPPSDDDIDLGNQDPHKGG
jgi:hypothetical protein